MSKEPLPLRRRFNSFFDATIRRPSLFTGAAGSRAVQCEEVLELADKGLKPYINYEYPDISKEVLASMVTPTIATNSLEDIKELEVPLRHDNFEIRIWNTFLTAISLLETIFTPLITAFPDANSIFIESVARFNSFCFIADILVSFLTAYKGKNGLYQVKLKKVAENYLLGYFVLDLLCVIARFVPFEDKNYIYNPTEFRTITMSSLYKNLVIVQGVKNFNSRNHLVKARGSSRSKFWIFRLLLLFLLFVHSYSIVLFFASQTADSTFYKLQPKSNNDYWFTRYSEFFLASFQILAGKNVILTTTLEKWIGIFGSILGILAQAYLLGEVTLLLQKLNARRTKWRLALEELDDSMTNMKLSVALKKRVKNAFAYWWAINGNQSTKNEWLNVVSPEIRTEVFLQINKTLLTKVPIFKDGSDDFLIAITEVLKTELYLPGGYVILHGAIGTDMFFVVYGTLQAMNKDETAVYALMSPGMFFGEISLLNPDVKRTATVRSFTYSQLSKLSRKDLDQALSKLPDRNQHELKGLQETAKERVENTHKIEMYRAKFELKKGKHG